MTSGTFSLADRDYIVEQLHTKILEVDFMKRDGTKRTMKCTLRADRLPPPEKPVIDLTKPERKDNPEVISVYDLESKGWRSFRIDSVESITIRESA
jgi:hypothetical protein